MKKHRLFAVFAAMAFVFTAFGCKTDVEEKDTVPPKEVTEFTVTASDGNAVLSWSEPKDADFRGVEISAEPAAGTLKRPVEVLKGTSSLEVTGLVLNTEYTFKVRTFDFSLNYSRGTECKATVTNSEDSTPPAEVTEFTATAADGNALLSWTKPADSDYAGVRISVTPAAGTLTNPVILGKDVTNLTVSGLTIGTEYTFKAETFDKSLNYSEGTEVIATVADNADYASPAEVTEFTATAADGNALLSWTKPADSDYAGVRISVTPAAGTLTNPVILGKDVTNLTVSGLTIGTEYTFKAETFDKSLNYSEGTEVIATVADNADYTSPAEVTEFTATAADGNALLSWTKPADSDYAGVRISVTPAAGTLTNPVILGKEVTNLTVSGLTIGTKYTFKAETFDKSLNYSEGTEVIATVADNADYTPPAEVTEFTATAADGNALLSWTKPADSDYAGVRISVTPAAGTLTNPVILGKEVTNLTVSGLTIGTKYTFKAETFDKSLNYSEGTEVIATVADNADYTPPAEVTEFAVVNKDAAALLTWKDPTDSDLFGIEVTYGTSTSSRAISVMEKESIFIAPGTENAVITGLTNGTLYTFTVKAMDLSGNKSTGVTKTLTPSIIEKSPLQITLTPDVTAKTNGNVTVSVSAVTDSASAVKKIAFTQGTVAEIGTVLGKTNITETKTFTVTENGSYTVAATDTAGRRELRWITVNNIDKTAPAAVTNLEAAYDYANKKVTISWKNPSDSDFAKAEVTYKLGAEEPVTVEVEKGVQKYELENIEPEVTVNVSVKAFDDVENAGVAVDTQTVTKATFAIRSITLSRDHLEYKSGKQITATIKGDNFNLLPTTGDEALTVKVYDGSTLVSSCTTVADVNTENNTATATFTSPDGTDSTTGKTYTVETVVNVEKQGVNTTFRVSSKPSIYSFYIYDANNSQVSAIPVSDVTAQTTVKATISAYNFDIADEIKLAFFDSTGNEVLGASKIVTKEDYAFKNTTSSETFSVNVPVPQDEGVYTLKAMWDGNVISSSYYKTLQIYGVVKFTSFTIPNAGTAANGTQLTATFKGKNFAAPDVDVSLFKATCDSKKTITADSSVTVINDTTATVLLTIPDTEGTYNVTLTYGEESTNADFVVRDTSSYNVGDVMLSDGTKVDYQENQTFTDEQKSKAVAVIGGFRNGVPLGVGIVHNRSGLAWCTSNAAGDTTNITTLQGDKTSGYMDGSDGWEKLKAACSDAESNPEKYPAWNYCRNYGATNGLTGDLATGWYLPTVAELYTIYQNKAVVDESLSKAGGSTFGTSWYWSCCQYPSLDYNARVLSFGNGYMDYYYKGSYDNSVCSVRAFN